MNKRIITGVAGAVLAVSISACGGSSETSLPAMDKAFCQHWTDGLRGDVESVFSGSVFTPPDNVIQELDSDTDQLTSLNSEPEGDTLGDLVENQLGMDLNEAAGGAPVGLTYDPDQLVSAIDQHCGS